MRERYGILATVHPLDGVQAKLDRAFEHAKCLSAQLKSLDNSDFYDTTVVERRNRDETVISLKGYLRVKAQPPIQLGIVAGDFAQNARAALDHLIYQVALLSTKKPGGTFFPIARTETEYMGPGPCDSPSLRDRALAGIPEEHRTFVDEEQPYLHPTKETVDRHMLAVLGAFSNADKHRVLHAAALRPLRLHAYPVVGDCTIELTLPKKQPRVLTDGAHVYSARLTDFSQPDVKVKVDLHFAIGFGGVGLTDGDMKNLCMYVGGVIEKFRPLFL